MGHFPNIKAQLSIAYFGLLSVHAFADEAAGLLWLKSQTQSDIKADSKTTELIGISEVSKALKHLANNNTSFNFEEIKSKEHSLEGLVRFALLAHYQNEDEATQSVIWTQIKNLINKDGGFSHLPYWQSNSLDTAFVLLALSETNFLGRLEASEKKIWESIIVEALNYLVKQQQTDGSFQVVSLDKLYVSSYVLSAITTYIGDYPALAQHAQRTVTFLSSKQVEAGKWSNQLFIDALVAESIHPYTEGNTSIYDAFKSRVLGNQSSNGSWDDDAYTTAIILDSLSKQSQPAVNPISSAITLSVVDSETGLPLQGATLSASSNSPKPVNAVSDIDGNFNVTDISAGDYTFILNREGYNSISFDLTLRQGQTLKIEQIKLSRAVSSINAQIQGSVTDSSTGTAISNAQVTVVMVNDRGQPLPNIDPIVTRTDATGSYQAILPQSGKFGIDVRKEGFIPINGSGSANAGGVVLFSPKLSSEAGFNASVVGKVIDRQNQPLANVQILDGSNVVATSDSLGRFTVNKVNAGTKTWQIKKDGFLISEMGLVINQSRNYDVGTITLLDESSTLPAGIINVSAKSASGKPISGILITAEKLKNGSIVTQTQQFSLPNTGNSAEVSLPVGQWRITVSHPSYNSDVAVFDVENQQTINHTPALALKNYAIQAKLVDAQTNQVISGAHYKVIDNNTNAVLATGTTDSFGMILRSDIVKPNIRIEVSASNYLTATRYVDRNNSIESLIDVGDIRVRSRESETLLPDLIVTQIDKSNTNTSQQSIELSGEVTVSLKNKGTSDTRQSFELVAFEDKNTNKIFDANDQILGKKVVNNQSLPINSELKINLPVSGKLKFRDAVFGVFIDSKSEVAEQNEQNNIRWTNQQYIDAPKLDLTQSKPLSPSWVANNQSFVNAPLVETLLLSNQNNQFVQTQGIFYIDQNGTLKCIDGKTGNLIWKNELGLAQNYTSLNDKIIIAKNGNDKQLFVTDSKNKKILQFKLTGEPIKEFAIAGSQGEYSSDKISFFYEDSTLRVFTEDGILNPSNSDWTKFQAVENLFRGDLQSFYSYEYAQRLLLIKGALFTTSGKLLKNDAGEPVYKAQGGQLNNNSFVVTDFDQDGELDIASKTCANSLASSRLTVYSLKKKANLFTSNGNVDCRFKESLTVADINGDAKPDIFYNGRAILNDGSVRWQLRRNSYESLQASAFDFNRDGQYEILVNRSNGLKIYNGTDGKELWSYETNSGANSPNPIVADVNGDQITDILLPSSNSACTDPQPFSESPLANTDTKLLIRWGGGPDLDINVEFDKQSYGWSYRSSRDPYIRWLGDNVSGGPERVSFNAEKIKALPGFETDLTFNLGAAWYSGYDRNNNWSQFEVSTKDGRCYSGFLNNITQSVSVRAPEYKVKVPHDRNNPIIVTDPQGNPVSLGNQAAKLVAFHGTAEEWGGTRPFWNEDSFKPEMFSNQGYPLQNNSIFPSVVRGNLPTDNVASIADLSASYIRLTNKSILGDSKLTARIGNAGGRSIPAGTPVSFYRIPLDNGTSGSPQLIGTARLNQAIASNNYLDISLNYAESLNNFGELVVVANDAGAGLDSANGIPVGSNATTSQVIEEYTRSNNIARLSINDGWLGISLAASIDKTSYAANEPVNITAIPENLSSLPISGVIRVQIIDSAGNVIKILKDQPVNLTSSLITDPKNSQTINQQWNTQSSSAGGYLARISLWRKSATSSKTELVATTDKPFSIVVDGATLGLTDSRIHTDKTVYSRNEFVGINSRIINTASNQIATKRDVTILIKDESGEVIWTQVYSYDQLAPNALKDQSFALSLSDVKPGKYSVIQTTVASDGSQGLQKVTTTFEVESSAKTGLGVSGTLTVDKPEIKVGENATFNFDVINSGDVVLSGLPLRLELFKDNETTAFKTISFDKVDLAISNSFRGSTSWLTDGEDQQQITAILVSAFNGQDKALAQTTFTLLQPIEATINDVNAVDDTLLVYYSCENGWYTFKQNWSLGHFNYPCFDERASNIQRYLNRLEIPHKLVKTPWQFRHELQSGKYNNVWLLGAVEKLTPHMYKELREAVHLGDNLVIDSGARSWLNHKLYNLTGSHYQGRLQLALPKDSGGNITITPPLFTDPVPVEIANIPLATQTLRAGQPLNSNWAIALYPYKSNSSVSATFDGAFKLSFFEEVLQSELKGGAPDNYYNQPLTTHPAVIEGTYGNGKPVALAFDLINSLKLATESELTPLQPNAPKPTELRWDGVLTQLLKPRELKPTDFLPLEPTRIPVVIDNKGNQERKVKVTVELPQGSKWLDNNAGIDAVNVNDASIQTYEMNIPANSQSKQLITLRLPGNTGAHGVRITITTNQGSQDKVVAAKEMRYLVRSVDERINLLKTQIDDFNVWSAEGYLVLNLKTQMNLIRKHYRNGYYELAVYEAARMGTTFSQMPENAQNKDIKALRLESNELLRALQMKWYMTREGVTPLP